VDAKNQRFESIVDAAQAARTAKKIVLECTVKNEPVRVYADGTWYHLTKLTDDRDAIREALFEKDDQKSALRYQRVDMLLDLTRELRSLADHLLFEAKWIEQQGEAASPNSLGIVQGRGMDVDRKCAVLWALMEMIERGAKS
jgi:hypothetical protein